MEINTRAVDIRETLDALEPLLSPAARREEAHACSRVDRVDEREGARRRGQTAAGHAQPAVQRGEVHAGGWTRSSLSCEHDERHVRIKVRDTGIGIPPAYLEPNLRSVRSAGASAHECRAGTGLGFAISRDLARAMGGDVMVESVPGRGSTFTVSLRQSEIIAALRLRGIEERFVDDDARDGGRPRLGVDACRRRLELCPRATGRFRVRARCRSAALDCRQASVVEAHSRR